MRIIRRIGLLFYTFLLFFHLQAQSQNLKVKNDISLSVKNTTVKQVFKRMEKHFGCDFVYDKRTIKNQPRVSFIASSIDEILRKLSEQTTLSFKRLDLLIAVSGKKSNSLRKENPDSTYYKVSGKILDEDTGEPLIGAAIQIAGTMNGTTTNSIGEFELLVPSIADFLKASYMGYEPKEIFLNNQKTLTVKMKPDITTLEEFVFIGYGTNKKKDLTGAISSVKPRDFNTGITSTPDDLLKGKIAGVQVNSNNGQPGVTSSLFVRGINSLTNRNNPLYIIDGIPLNVEEEGFSLATDFGRTTLLNPLNFINPSDIRSIDILKDASSAAIYGTRASNGVVIITTNDGSQSESGVSYSTYFGISKLRKKLDLFNGEQFRSKAREIGAEEQMYSNEIDTDWQDLLFRDAISSKHHVSFRNSNDHLNYYASLNYTSQEGIVESNVLKTYSGRVNINHVVNKGILKDKLEIPLKLNFSHVHNDGNAYSNDYNSNGTLMADVLQANPTYPAFNSDGTIFDFPVGRNPLVLLDQVDDYSRIDRVIGNVSPTLRLLENLTYQTNLAVDRSNYNREYQIAPSMLNDFGPIDGRVEFLKQETTNLLVENFLTYPFATAAYDISLLLGHSYQVFKNKNLTNSINGFSTTEIEAFNNPGIGTSLTLEQNAPLGFSRITELQSFFSRVNFSWLDQYLFTGTIRYDGSSRFGDNNKYGLFPSLAFAWKMSNEPLFKSLKERNISLKLRSSWGLTGSQNIPQGITLPLFLVSNDPDDSYPINGEEDTPGFTFLRATNENIKWEVTSQTNIGLDFSLFKGKLLGSVDYFRKSTTDILLNLINEDPLGVNSFWDNVDMQIINKGLELSLSYEYMPIKDLAIVLSGNASFLKNEVRDAPFQLITTSNSRGIANESIGVYTNGASVNSFYLLDFNGLDENGMSTYRDVNNDGAITDEDRLIAGSSIPTALFNFNIFSKYKGFSLGLAFNGVGGNKVYNSTLSLLSKPLVASGRNGSPQNFLSEESNNNLFRPSTRFLEDGSFLRLSNVTVAYDFNVKEFRYCKKLKVYVTGQNLLLFTRYSGYDPEVSNAIDFGSISGLGVDYTNYPVPLSFILGMDVTF
ncbi:SusC/RagA family TonB-linked outer membrane protein [Xanthovirga aplysinae]|uniref:SusC/RagA family TonB-linked outer membrane protein n=1 Tax=Xanthovirga aplysinae TaxID=2529853 RepID=UPI0012BCB559|nr:SusC/RagA family TonB-linked outer membrane protein [Xanthovirga aplysinae]MTI33254.1 SusC/RagA family TonB-linked outer membrane protein [Xanthovirga aplysinae]